MSASLLQPYKWSQPTPTPLPFTTSQDLQQTLTLTRGAITEFVGEAGTGKTQICLYMAVLAQREMNGKAYALFITTTTPFPIDRLKEIIAHHPDCSLDRILIYHVKDVDAFATAIPKIQQMIERAKVSLIIVDSIASHFRSDNDYMKRAQVLWDIADVVRTSDCVCIVTNQVTGIDGRQEAALGISWATVVGTRVMLERIETKRTMRIVFSPHLPNSQCEFRVEKAGIMGPAGSE